MKDNLRNLDFHVASLEYRIDAMLSHTTTSEEEGEEEKKVEDSIYLKPVIRNLNTFKIDINYKTIQHVEATRNLFSHHNFYTFKEGQSFSGMLKSDNN